MVGSITYDLEENSYNLEWETRANFNTWLSHKQKALRIKIQIAKTQLSKVQQQVYLTCETFHYTYNGCRGLKPYKKKTMQERKIRCKQIEGGCNELVHHWHT
jgi:hypothetical protein